MPATGSSPPAAPKPTREATRSPMPKRMLLAVHRKPGTAHTAPARHRRNQLPCTGDLTTDLLAIVDAYLGPAEMSDLRHRDAKAWADLEDWLAWLDLEGKRPRTLYNYERQAAILLRTNPDTSFDGFTADQINAALRKVPQRSRYITRSIYNQWFEWGEFDDRLTVNPMRKVPKMKAGKRRPTGLFSEAEVGLLTSLPSPDGVLWALLFGTGMRREDAIRLQRRHVDLDRGWLYIYDGKGGRDAELPIKQDLAAALADFDLVERLRPADHFWYRAHYNTSRRTPISSSEFARWYKRNIEAAGVRYLKPHTTRHTYHWILKHVDELGIEERMLMMRHESPETTVRQYPAVAIEDVARTLAGR